MTQPNLILSTLLKFFLVLSLSFTFVSCVSTSTDDDDLDPQGQDVMFRVDLVKINALEIKEGEGDHLEIYGTIDSKLIRGNITESNTLWSRDGGEALAVGLSDLPLVSSTIYTVASSDIENTNLEVRADLFDYDGSGTNAPEDLGNEVISTPLVSITSSVTYQIVLNDSGGQVIQLTFSVTRL